MPGFDVGHWLVGPERTLFAGQATPDRKHAIRVAHWLVSRGYRDPLLIRAALLHDVGKPGSGLSIWARVAWTLGWPVKALADHEARGLAMLRQAGVDERVVALVAQRDQLLAKADDSV